MRNRTRVGLLVGAMALGVPALVSCGPAGDPCPPSIKTFAGPITYLPDGGVSEQSCNAACASPSSHYCQQMDAGVFRCRDTCP